MKINFFKQILLFIFLFFYSSKNTKESVSYAVGSTQAEEKPEDPKLLFNVNFFEEYPNDTNLEKAKLIDFHCTVYLAARSVKEFLGVKKKLENINPKCTAAYWPILPESYWISPFSSREELNNLFSDLTLYAESLPDGDSLSVLFDLELPLKVKKYLENTPWFKKNKQAIERFLANPPRGTKVVTAEYLPSRVLTSKRLKDLGLAYPHLTPKRIVMFYTSMLEPGEREVAHKSFKEQVKGFKGLQVGLGTTATGVFGDEPILSPNGLRDDIILCKSLGVKDVTIFRLGGMTPAHMEAIESLIYANK